MPSLDVAGYLDAWRRRDFDRILDLHAEDLTLEVPFWGRLSRGKERLARRLEAGAMHIAEVDVEPRHVVQQGREAAALLRMGVRYAGEVAAPDGSTIDVEGKRLDLDVALFLSEGEDGRIVEETWVYDVAAAARQLGCSLESLERLREEAAAGRAASPT